MSRALVALIVLAIGLALVACQSGPSPTPRVIVVEVTATPTPRAVPGGKTVKPTTMPTPTAGVPTGVPTKPPATSLPTPTVAPGPKPSPSPTGQPGLSMGTVFGLDDTFKAVVLGWRKVEEKVGIEEIGQQVKHYVVVDMLVFNTTSQVTTFDPVLVVSLVDTTGREAQMPISLGEPHFLRGLLEGRVLPHTRLRGEIYFPVPEEFQVGKGMTLLINDMGARTVVVRLSDTPKTVPVPPDFPQDNIATVPQGQPAYVGQWAVTVWKAQLVSSPPQEAWIRLYPGREYLVVDLTVENRGQQTGGWSSYFYVTMQDDTGYRYPVDIDAAGELYLLPGGKSVDGLYAPGQKKRGTLVFQVLKEAQKFYLNVVPDGDHARIAIIPTPGK